MTNAVTKSEDKFRKHMEKWQKQLIKAKEQFEEKWSKEVKCSGKVTDFDLVKKIGCGAFGTVLLVSFRSILVSYS